MTLTIPTSPRLLTYYALLEAIVVHTVFVSIIVNLSASPAARPLFSFKTLLLGMALSYFAAASGCLLVAARQRERRPGVFRRLMAFAGLSAVMGTFALFAMQEEFLWWIIAIPIYVIGGCWN